MDKKLLKKTKILYNLKIRSVQIYGAQSRKIKDSDTSLLFQQLSLDEYNHAKGLKYFLESNDLKVSVINKILNEMDSFWCGFFSYYLGSSFVKKYNSKREKIIMNYSKYLVDVLPNEHIFHEIKTSAENHLEILSSL